MLDITDENLKQYEKIGLNLIFDKKGIINNLY